PDLAGPADQPGDRLEQGGLAGAVRADDREPAAGRGGEPDVGEHRPAAETHAQAAHLHPGRPGEDRWCGRAHTPSRLVARRTAMKNGAPTNAVTTPIGSSAGASASRATRSARTRKAAPPSSESGSTVRYDQPARRRTAWGTTAPTNPMGPLTATADAVASDAASSTATRVRPACRPRLVASSSPTESTSRSRPCSRSTALESTAYGAIIRSWSQPPPTPPRIQA